MMQGLGVDTSASMGPSEAVGLKGAARGGLFL